MVRYGVVSIGVAVEPDAYSNKDSQLNCAGNSFYYDPRENISQNLRITFAYKASTMSDVIITVSDHDQEQLLKNKKINSVDSTLGSIQQCMHKDSDTQVEVYKGNESSTNSNIVITEVDENDENNENINSDKQVVSNNNKQDIKLKKTRNKITNEKDYNKRKKGRTANEQEKERKLNKEEKVGMTGNEQNNNVQKDAEKVNETMEVIITKESTELNTAKENTETNESTELNEGKESTELQNEKESPELNGSTESTEAQNEEKDSGELKTLEAITPCSKNSPEKLSTPDKSNSNNNKQNKRPSCRKTRSDKKIIFINPERRTRSNSKSRIPVIHSSATAFRSCEYYRQKILNDSGAGDWINYTTLQKSAGQKVVKKITAQQKKLEAEATAQKKKEIISGEGDKPMHPLQTLIPIRKKPTKLEPIRFK